MKEKEIKDLAKQISRGREVNLNLFAAQFYELEDTVKNPLKEFISKNSSHAYKSIENAIAQAEWFHKNTGINPLEAQHIMSCLKVLPESSTQLLEFATKNINTLSLVFTNLFDPAERKEILANIPKTEEYNDLLARFTDDHRFIELLENGLSPLLEDNFTGRLNTFLKDGNIKSLTRILEAGEPANEAMRIIFNSSSKAAQDEIIAKLSSPGLEVNAIYKPTDHPFDKMIKLLTFHNQTKTIVKDSAEISPKLKGIRSLKEMRKVQAILREADDWLDMPPLKFIGSIDDLSSPIAPLESTDIKNPEALPEATSATNFTSEVDTPRSHAVIEGMTAPPALLSRDSTPIETAQKAQVNSGGHGMLRQALDAQETTAVAPSLVSRLWCSSRRVRSK